jgi:hypothetical protein
VREIGLVPAFDRNHGIGHGDVRHRVNAYVREGWAGKILLDQLIPFDDHFGAGLTCLDSRCDKERGEDERGR